MTRGPARRTPARAGRLLDLNLQPPDGGLSEHRQLQPASGSARRRVACGGLRGHDTRRRRWASACLRASRPLQHRGDRRGCTHGQLRGRRRRRDCRTPRRGPALTSLRTPYASRLPRSVGTMAPGVSWLRIRPRRRAWSRASGWLRRGSRRGRGGPGSSSQRPAARRWRGAPAPQWAVDFGDHQAKAE